MADDLNQETNNSPAANPAVEREGMTRRQLLVSATAGGAALAAGALGGAAVGSLATRAEYELELAKLRTLVALYEQLERIGIDAVISAGMNVVRGALETVRAGVGLVRQGVTAAQNALTALQGMMDALKAEVDRATQGLNGLMNNFRAAESLVTGALGKAQPLSDSISGFFNALIDKIPFGIGDNLRKGVDALVTLIRGIPIAVETVTAQLIKPITDTFFPATGTPQVKTSVIDPITQNLLAPLNKFLGDVDNLVAKWENDFTKPVQTALDQRADIRKQIQNYRQENKMG